MLVRDVMTPDPVTVRPTDTLHTAKDRMMEADCRRLPVLDDEGSVCGIISDRDVRLAMNSPLIMRERWQDDLLIDHTQVDACMTPDPFCIALGAPLEDAAELMLTRKISGLPVVDGDRLVGIVTVTDMLHALVQLLQEVR